MVGNDFNETHQIPEILKNLLETHEDWLMEQILMYAKKQGYTAYTSTLKEAWRLSVSGLSASMREGLCRYSEVPEMTPEEDFSGDPIAGFGIIEAKRHKERGVSLNMFLSLKALQANNRLMTNEKNKYLTIFESIPNPVILLNSENEIDNLNFAAVNLFKENLSPGSQYYRISKQSRAELETFLNQGKSGGKPDHTIGIQLFEFLPWLKNEVEEFRIKHLGSLVFEKSAHYNGQDLIFRVKLSKNLDISGKYQRTVIILEDITSLKHALANVKQLTGLLPICSHCKKIRDDKGYWNQIEVYIDQHSEAKFSHGICKECAKKYYPALDLYDDKPKD